MATNGKADPFPYGTRPDWGGQIHHIGHCECGWRVESRNAFGLCAQHAGRTGHRVGIEIASCFVWNDRDPEDAQS